MHFTTEILIVDQTPFFDYLGFQRHVFRYLFASKFCQGKKVLDVACGSGYGSHFLSSSGAKKVIGIDISQAFIDYSQSNYQRKNLILKKADALKMPFAAGSFEVVVCFETLEHVKDAPKLLKEVCRVLKPGGLLICSTPNKLFYSFGFKKPLCPFHIHEFYRRELKKMLEIDFDNIKSYCQDYFSVFYWIVKSLFLSSVQVLLPLDIRKRVIDKLYLNLTPKPKRKKYSKIINKDLIKEFEKKYQVRQDKRGLFKVSPHLVFTAIKK